MDTLAGIAAVGKETGKTPKRYGTLIRVSDEFADAMRDLTSIERVSAAEFMDANVLAMVRKRYRDAILRKAKAVEGGKP